MICYWAMFSMLTYGYCRPCRWWSSQFYIYKHEIQFFRICVCTFVCHINISWVYLCGARIDVPRSTIYVEQEWPCLFPIIIGLSVEISGNPTKHLAYFHFYGNPIQRFELREARIEKRENLRFSRTRLDYKLSENKQGLDVPRSTRN